MWSYFTYISLIPLLNYNFRCFRAFSFQFVQPSILLLSNKIFSKNTRKLGKPWRSKPLTLTVFLFMGCTVQGSWNKNQPILKNGTFMFGKSLKITIYHISYLQWLIPQKRLVGGWTNPLRNICSSNWIICPRFGVKLPPLRFGCKETAPKVIHPR